MFPRFDRKYFCLSCSALLLLLLPFLATLSGEPYLVSLFSRILIYALAAASLDLILGYGGFVSLGHAAFFGSPGHWLFQAAIMHWSPGRLRSWLPPFWPQSLEL